MSNNAERISVFVEGEGLDEIILLELSPDDTVEAILSKAKEKGAIVDDETVLVIGADEDPVDRKSSVRDKKIGKHDRLHVHRCKKVRVEFNYQGESKDHEFGTNKTVAKIRAWALEKFPIDPAMQANIILQFCGTTKEPDLDRHIGTFAKHGECRVCFNLVLDPRVQG